MKNLDGLLCLLKKEEIQELQKSVQFFKTAADKKIAYYQYGDLNGEPILFMHGSGSHIHAMLWHKPAKEYGFHIIVPDRPGIGRSDFLTDWTLQNYATDLVALAGELGISKFAVAGISGGGPSLMALARYYPDYLKCVISMACSMPLYTDSKMLSKLGFTDRLYALVGAKAPLSVFKFQFYILKIVMSIIKSPKLFKKMFNSSLCAADKKLFADENFQYLFVSDFKELFNSGSVGAAYDGQSNYKKWGFDIAEINFPIEIFHGTDDKFVPLQFSEYLLDKVKGSTLNRIEQAGHFYHLAYGYHILRIVREKYYR